MVNINNSAPSCQMIYVGVNIPPPLPSPPSLRQMAVMMRVNISLLEITGCYDEGEHPHPLIDITGCYDVGEHSRLLKK